MLPVVVSKWTSMQYFAVESQQNPNMLDLGNLQ